MIKGLDLAGSIKAFRKKMEKMQEELEQKTVEASSGGGMVTVVVNGMFEVVDLTIDPRVVNPDDVDMLEDLIIAAVNDGLKKAQELMNSELLKLEGDLINIPGLPRLF